MRKYSLINFIENPNRLTKKINNNFLSKVFNSLYFFFLDLLIVFIAFLIAHAIDKPTYIDHYQYYKHPFIIFACIWTITSLLSRKYIVSKPLKKWVIRIIKSDILCALVILLMIVIVDISFSYLRILTIMFIAFTIEGIIAYFYVLHVRIVKDLDNLDKFYRRYSTETNIIPKNIYYENFQKALRYSIVNEIGQKAFEYILPFLNNAYSKTRFLSADTNIKLDYFKNDEYAYFVNLHPINNFKRISKFFIKINDLLPIGGTFIGNFQTNEHKKELIAKKYTKNTAFFVYLYFFAWHRVCSKLPIIKILYFFITGGYHRAISKAEVFGRLYSCGFEIFSENNIDNLLYFVAKKRASSSEILNPTYGPIIALRRVGKDGKMITTYKLRTMYAYSEFLQDYVYNLKGLEVGGKLKDDFRVTTLGRMLRKYWIDELPMILNLIKGDVKLVGVRPLSLHYFNLYPEDLKAKRIKTKPGLIPPFYYDLPQTLEEIIASELKYLESYEKAPSKTDWNYFCRAMYNIFIKKAKSR